MKKKIIASGIAAAVMVSSFTAGAKVLYPDSVQRRIEMGYSAEDACCMSAIRALGGNEASELIYRKYRTLGGWEATAEYYEVNMEEFAANIRYCPKNIPDDIYGEMKAKGMTDEECYDFARRSGNVQMDIAVTWEANKNGKTISDLIKEQTAQKNAELNAAMDLTFGKITATEYTEKMKIISPDMDVEEVLEFARRERNSWIEFRRATSHITDEELKAAADAGVTDFFDACRIKDSVMISNLTFDEMLSQIKQGKDIDSVLKDSVSADKINSGIAERKKETE